MPDAAAITTTGTALVASGWFANKLFGPSADALGEQLKVYFSGRLTEIFGRSAAIAEERQVAPNPVPPGLLARMVIDSSFSDPAEGITEWWANLFVDASLAASNRHVAFSDIMALLGPLEAKCLQDFYRSFSFGTRDSFFDEAHNLSASVETLLEEAAAYWLGELPITSETVFRLRNNMLGGEVPWPVRPVIWSFPMTRPDGSVHRSNMANPWYSENLMSIGILERAGVLQTSKATVSGFGFTSWVKAVAMTPLGLEFYRVCTGKAVRR